MSKVDSMIEAWAKGRAGSVRASVDTPLAGFENFSLTPPTKQAEAPSATPLDAAQAVREAVAAKKGRRPKVSYWKPVAAKALGISKLFAKRWQGVLDAGVEAGLFTLDSDTLKHPFLVAGEITEPEPAPVVKTKTKAAPEPDPEPVSQGLPEGWMPPVVMKCGHMNWPHHGTDEDDPKQVAAREAGHCCAAYAEAAASHKRMNPNGGGKPHLTVQWRVRGLHDPVPRGLRRTKGKEAGPGFPGLCCHPKTGLYIGGIGNDCRFHKGKARCESHARSK